MNLREKGTKWLADKIEQQVSTEVLYRRGSQSLPIKAGMLKSQKQIIDANGALSTLVSHDFTVRSEQLQFDSEKLTPESGDIIEVNNGETTRVFAVKSFGDPHGEPFTWCDPFGVQYRIHTTFEGEVDNV